MAAMSEWEWGIEYSPIDGASEGGKSPFGSEAAARAFLADHKGREWHPKPVALVRRACGEWQRVEDNG